MEAVVMESSPRWAPELERQFAGEDVRVRVCRSPLDLDRGLAERHQHAVPRSARVIVLDLEVRAADGLRFLGRRTASSAGAAVIVVGLSRTRALEWLVRELGAVAYLDESASGEELARVCRRQWRQSLAQGSRTGSDPFAGERYRTWADG